MIGITEYEPEFAAEWKDFLESSNNGTLFHDLDFLAYHPASKFDTHHLVFRDEDGIVGLFPAAIIKESDGRKILRSPYGASVGGFALPVGQSAETAMALVSGLTEYAGAQTLDAVEIRIAPTIYMREPNDSLSFAFMAGGFRLTRRWLCHAIPLPENPDEVIERCKKGKARDIRAGLRRGLNPREVGGERVPDFYRLLIMTERKHNARPTHRQEEIEDLCRRVPGRLRLFLCEKDGEEMAGVLVFVLNDRVGYTFYICQNEEQLDPFATPVLIAHTAGTLAGDGFRFLDLGPSTFDDMTLNRGLAFFKEGFGGRGFCRDTWRWERG